MRRRDEPRNGVLTQIPDANVMNVAGGTIESDDGEMSVEVDRFHFAVSLETDFGNESGRRRIRFVEFPHGHRLVRPMAQHQPVLLAFHRNEHRHLKQVTAENGNER